MNGLQHEKPLRTLYLTNKANTTHLFYFFKPTRTNSLSLTPFSLSHTIYTPNWTICRIINLLQKYLINKFHKLRQRVNKGFKKENISNLYEELLYTSQKIVNRNSIFVWFTVYAIKMKIYANKKKSLRNQNSLASLNL